VGGGKTFLASRVRHGKPANGRSYRPVLDGDSDENSRCVAFISEASNLVRHDSNGVADAFVMDLSSRKIKRVSVSTSGKQADGPTHEVAISGDCSRVAFSTDATNLGTRATDSGAARGSVNGHEQVYLRFISGAHRGLTLAGVGIGQPASG